MTPRDGRVCYRVSGNGRMIFVEPTPPEAALEQLRYFYRRRCGGRFIASWHDLFERTESGIQIEAGFCQRVVAVLRSCGATCRISPLLQVTRDVEYRPVAVNVAGDQWEIVEAMLSKWPGAVAFTQRERVSAITAALAVASGGRGVVTITPTVEQARTLYLGLKRPLAAISRTLGALVGSTAEDGDTVLMTATSLETGVIPLESIRTLIFCDAPRSGIEWLSAVGACCNARKYCLLTRRQYSNQQRLLLEGTFGPIVVG